MLTRTNTSAERLAVAAPDFGASAATPAHAAWCRGVRILLRYCVDAVCPASGTAPSKFPTDIAITDMLGGDGGGGGPLLKPWAGRGTTSHARCVFVLMHGRFSRCSCRRTACIELRQVVIHMSSKVRMMAGRTRRVAKSGIAQSVLCHL